MADASSPTSNTGFHQYLASPNQLLPAAGGMPTTANFVHLVYGDTDGAGAPRFEYRFSTKLHIAYEAHRITNVGGPVAGNEETLYARAGFDTNGTFVLETSEVNISSLLAGRRT